MFILWFDFNPVQFILFLAEIVLYLTIGAFSVDFQAYS